MEMEWNLTDGGQTAVRMEEEEGAVGGTPTTQQTPNEKGKMGDGVTKNFNGQGGQPQPVTSGMTADMSSDSGVWKVEPLLEELDGIGSNLRRSRVTIPKCPFEIFPEEVWERILVNLMDSQDVLNVFRVFPALDGLVLKNKYEWLIDQVMPHIFPLLDARAVLTCRQVSRRWSRGVDNFLENHPQKRAYDHGSQLTGQLRIPEASKAHYTLERRFKGVRRFTRKETFTDFMVDMYRHEPTRNPFVGRSLVIDETYLNERLNHEDAEEYGHWEWDEGVLFRRERLSGCNSFWNNDALPFLGSYGDHIWFLEIGSDFDENTGCGALCSVVVQLLKLLPNLKGLKINLKEIEISSGYHGEVAVAEAVDALEAHYRTSPNHPALESLELNTESEYLGEIKRFFRSLLRILSSTIKRLKFAPFPSLVDYFALSPKLTEFTIFCDDRDHVTEVLPHLMAPQLRRLEVHLRYSHHYPVNGNDIISWLGKFLKLHSFNLHLWGSDGGMYAEDDDLAVTDSRKVARECEGVSLAPGCIPALKSFVIDGEPFEISFDFWRCFPSLEYLKIEASGQPHYFKEVDLYGTIWEALPKLKEMNISMWEDGEGQNCFFNRMKYDWLKKRLGEE